MNFACSSQKGCSRVPSEKSRLGPAEEIARNIFFITGELQMSRVASTIRLVGNPEYNFSARMMRRGLSLRRDRFAQRQHLGHTRLDFPLVDQVGNLCEIIGIGMTGDTRAANSMFLKLGRIRSRDQ